MALELTFKQVCDFAKQDAPQDAKLIEAVDYLLGFTLVCAPLVIGPAAALLPTLAVKNELIKLGKLVFDKLTKKKDDNYLAKQQRMQATYGLLCFTAFFEALDQRIPKELRERIHRLKSETLILARNAVARVAVDAKDCADGPQLPEPFNPLARWHESARARSVPVTANQSIAVAADTHRIGNPSSLGKHAPAGQNPCVRSQFFSRRAKHGIPAMRRWYRRCRRGLADIC